MRQQRTKPYYKLSLVQSAVDGDRFRSTERVRRWLQNHGYSPNDLIKEVVGCLTESDYYKSIEMEVIPGLVADVYRTRCEDEDWYLKLFMDEETEITCVSIYTCCWDGFQH